MDVDTPAAVSGEGHYYHSYPRCALFQHYIKLAKSMTWGDYNVLLDMLLSELVIYKGREITVFELMIEEPLVGQQIKALAADLRNIVNGRGGRH